MRARVDALPTLGFAMLAAIVLSSGMVGGCATGDCQHGSWAETDGWQCHDQNDERGPQRPQPSDMPWE